MKILTAFGLAAFAALGGCGGKAGNSDNSKALAPSSVSRERFTEGSDYMLYERVRLMDNRGFTEPQEAYSILLPRGWQHEGEIIWNQPGSLCAGTFRRLKAGSEDGRYVFELFPDVLYSWNTDPALMQFYRDNGGNSGCEAREPMEAEAYLRNVFAVQLGSPEVLSVESNPLVVDQMKQLNARAMSELQQYGAGQMDFKQTAVNATLRWTDGMEGLVTLGVTIISTMVPNVYTGGYSQMYTTQVTRQTVFKYPSDRAQHAKQQFAVIMASFRTNPAWNRAVNDFWRETRMQSHTVHVGKIKMMDEQTRRMGEQAVRHGEQRLRNMDVQMRNWEQRQSSEDRIHAEFIKTIREVENFRDENGKYEVASGYDHVWSRGDGNNFILSDNANFDPSSVFQDQRWKPMKKVQ